MLSARNYNRNRAGIWSFLLFLCALLWTFVVDVQRHDPWYIVHGTQMLGHLPPFVLLAHCVLSEVGAKLEHAAKETLMGAISEAVALSLTLGGLRWVSIVVQSVVNGLPWLSLKAKADLSFLVICFTVFVSASLLETSVQVIRVKTRRIHDSPLSEDRVLYGLPYGCGKSLAINAVLLILFVSVIDKHGRIFMYLYFCVAWITTIVQCSLSMRLTLLVSPSARLSSSEISSTTIHRSLLCNMWWNAMALTVFYVSIVGPFYFAASRVRANNQNLFLFLFNTSYAVGASIFYLCPKFVKRHIKQPLSALLQHAWDWFCSFACRWCPQ